MFRPTVACLLLLGLISVAHAQNLLDNGGFEAGVTGWQVVAPAETSVRAIGDRPAAGKGSVLLQTTGKAVGWLLSPVLSGAASGDLVQVSFAARRAAGQASLVLDVIAGPETLSDAVLWEAALPADAAWHRVVLLMRVPPVGSGVKPRLAFGVRGQAGSWALDEVSVTTGTLPAPEATTLPGEPSVCEPLDDGWKPEGLLDARAVTIGDSEELALNVGGLEVTVDRELTGYRGYREGLIIYAVNRGSLDKQLVITAAAPNGLDSAGWTVPVRANGTTRFHHTVQPLCVGDSYLKLTFACGGEQAAAPVKISAKRCYPAFGVLWEDTAAPDEVAALRRIPLDLQVGVAAPDRAALGPLADVLGGRGTDIFLAPRGDQLTDQQFQAALAELGGQLEPSFWVPWAAPGTDAAPLLTAATGFGDVQRQKVRPAGVFTPPLALRRTWPDGQLVPVQGELLSAERMTSLQAVTVRPPRLGAASVLSEQVDGKADVLSGALVNQNRQADLASVRGLLMERQINLPLLVADLQARPAGDERLDALWLARALTLSLYQGATGAVMAAHRTADNAFGLLPSAGPSGKPGPLTQVLSELSQELAAATPVVGLAATDNVSLSPRAPISFRPFLRGGEGIVVLWNNTGAPKDVALEFRSQPVVGNYLRFSYYGDFAQRHWDPIFRFPEEAFRSKRPVFITHLNPLDVQVLSFRLLDPHAAWLRRADLATAAPPARETAPVGREERSWWSDMLKIGGAENRP